MCHQLTLQVLYLGSILNQHVPNIYSPYHTPLLSPINKFHDFGHWQKKKYMTLSHVSDKIRNYKTKIMGPKAWALLRAGLPGL